MLLRRNICYLDDKRQKMNAWNADDFNAVLEMNWKTQEGELDIFRPIV